MLALNKKTDYGLIALSCLAVHPGQVVSARRIAETYGMRPPLLMNVLKALSRGGLIVSVRGSRGGYRLARPAKEINLAQLVRALQGPLRLVACANQELSNGASECDLAESCPVQSPVRKVHLKMLDFLQGISLAELSAQTAAG